MKRKISLLLAIVMIATTVMAAMPVMTFTAVAAEETQKTGVSIYTATVTTNNGVTTYTATDTLWSNGGTTYDGVALNSAITAANAATETIVVKFNEDVAMPSVTPNNKNATVVYDGNGHTMTFNGHNGWVLNGVSVVFQNMDIYLTFTGTAFKVLNTASLTFDNVVIGGTSGGHAVVNFEDGAADKIGYLTIRNSVVAVNLKNTFGYSPIGTGNDGVVNTPNITIDSSAVYGDYAVYGKKASNVTVNINNSTIWAKKGIAIGMNDASKNNNDKYSYKITGDSYIVSVNNDFSSATSEIISGANFEALTGNEGFKSGGFATVIGSQGTVVADSWADIKNAVAASTSDVTVTLNTDAVVSKVTLYNHNMVGTGESARPVKIAFNGNNKRIVSLDGNAIELAEKNGDTFKTDILVKDFTYKYFGVGSAIQSFACGDVDINNVDIICFGALNYAGINSLNPGTEAAKVDMDLYDVNITVKNKGNNNNAAALRMGNGASSSGGTNYVDWTIENCNIDIPVTVAEKPVTGIFVTTPNAVVTIINTKVSANENYAVKANGTAIMDVDTLSTFTSNIKDSSNRPLNPIEGTPSVPCDVTVNGTRYTDWKSAVAATTAETNTIVLNSDLDLRIYGKTTAAYSSSFAKATTIDGNNKTINVNSHNVFVAKTDFEIKNATVNQSFDGTLFKLGAAGENGSPDYTGSTVDISGVTINVSGNGIVINAIGHENNNPDDGVTKTMYLNIASSIIETTHSTATNAVIQFGNAKEDVRLTMTDSNIDDENGSRNVINTNGSVGSITLNNTDIDAKNGYAIKTNSKVLVKMDDASAVTKNDNIALSIDGDPNVPANVTVNGTAYTDWKSAVAAATAEENTIVLNGDVDLGIGGRTTGTYQSTFTKPTVIDGNGYTFSTCGTSATNVFIPKTDFELKNMKINHAGARGILQIGEVGADFEGAEVRVENVDIVAGGNGVAMYTLINGIGHAGTETEAANRGKIKLDLVDVNITVNATTGKDGTAAVIRWGNGNDHMDLTMINSSINTANDAGRAGLYVTAGSTGSIKLVNTEIKTAGTAINNLANIAVNTFDATIEGAVTGDAPANKVETAVTMTEGASVRLSSGSNGIRFTSKIPAATLEAIAAIADNTDFKFGTIITVEEAVVANGGVFKPTAEMIANGTFGGWKIRNIPGVIDNGVTVNAPAEGATYGDVEIRAALVNVKDNHITTKYAAVAYVEYTYMGETCYAYSDYDPANNRSMYEIATKALADLKTPEDEGYDPTKHLYEVGGKYSPYTGAQRKTLQAYLDKAAELDLVP